MSGKLKNSSPRKNKPAPDRPFAAEVWARAGQIARGYRLILEEEPEVGFLGRALEMPYVMADGSTPGTCVAALREALAAAVATMLEQGQTPPQAAGEPRRNTQINIRLTAEEKLLLEEQSRRAGYRGLSDYVRNTVLQRAG